MFRKKWIFLLTGFTVLITSCMEDIQSTINPVLTEQEVVQGLKSALTVSTDTAVGIVSKIDGYYQDALIKILLPEEAGVILDHLDDPLLQAVGIDTLVETAVLSMNRAAEDAAKEAVPIFVNAITSMTIADAFSILNSNDTAATHYLREKTYSPLIQAYTPEIDASLDKPLLLGVSTNEIWGTLTTTYNSVAMLTGWQQVNTSLTQHVTTKALNGLFLKISDEEKEIRNNPLDRINEILKKVFGNG